MRLAVIGIGMGNPMLLTEQARQAIAQANCLIGARRILDAVGEGKTLIEAVASAEIVQAVSSLPDDTHAAVLVSGDVGFYSASAGITALANTYEIEYICGISSLQYFCARLGMSWEDARIVSLHGRKQNLIAAVATSAKTFVLTGGDNSARAVCALLCENMLEDVAVCVGENLSYDNERITHSTARELAERDFAPLCVLMIQNDCPQSQRVDFGLPDDIFVRGDTPMTKSEVRAVTLAALRLRQHNTVWDVGAGTGSVAIELARLLPDGRIYAIERDVDALVLIRKNKEKFALPLLRIVSGTAPGALEKLPAPDRVFIGGASGQLSAVVELALDKNPKVRIVINAISLETLQEAIACFAAHRLGEPEIVQITAARAKKAGDHRMMLGQNPVYIISGGGEPDA